MNSECVCFLSYFYTLIITIVWYSPRWWVIWPCIDGNLLETEFRKVGNLLYIWSDHNVKVEVFNTGVRNRRHRQNSEWGRIDFLFGTCTNPPPCTHVHVRLALACDSMAHIVGYKNLHSLHQDLPSPLPNDLHPRRCPEANTELHLLEVGRAVVRIFKIVPKPSESL